MTDYQRKDIGTLILRHPLWIKVLGWVVMPFLGLCGVFMMALPVIEPGQGLGLTAVYLVLGASLLRMCFVVFQVFPFLRASIEFSDGGFVITQPNSTIKRYEWSDVAKMEHHVAIQVLILKNKQGKTMLAITEQAHNYSQFVAATEQKVEIKY